MGISGRCAVVTGGSRGIGREICMELAAQGAHIVLGYAGDAQKAEQTRRDCELLGVRAVAVRCDVRRADEVQAMIDAALSEFGRVDILVNNAGITRDGLLLTAKEERFDEVMDTNLKGAYLCMRAAVRTMMRQRYGRIVNMSSVVALRGNAGRTSYTASKAGIIGLTKSAAKELISRGITVNAVAPGFIDTDMTAAMPDAAKAAALAAIPAGRMGEAKDVARAVAFLAADEAGYITGQVLAVDGGMSM